MTGPKLIIGMALNAPINPDLKKFIEGLISTRITRRVIRVLCGPDYVLNDTDWVVTYLPDDPKLFDFSRYHRILRSEIIEDDDIVFLVNDTLGAGRKARFGLKLFCKAAIRDFFRSGRSGYTIWGPVDHDKFGDWISPYFMIGRAGDLKKLSLMDWRRASKDLDKDIKLQLISWLQSGWRGSAHATNKQRKIKYKTLLIERRLMVLAGKVKGFHKYDVRRIINSIFPF